MILSDKGIKEALDNGGIEISDYEDRQLQPASYDLRVGKQGATIQGKKIEDISEKGFIVVEPGDSALISTHEIIAINQSYAARFDLTSRLARKGIYATTGAQIDPGFHGRLFARIVNPTSRRVSFTFKEDFLTLEIHKLSQPSENSYSGPLQGKTELGGADVESLISSEVWTMSDVIKSIQSLDTNVQVLTGKVNMLMWIVPIALGIMSVVIALVSLK